MFLYLSMDCMTNSGPCGTGHKDADGKGRNYQMNPSQVIDSILSARYLRNGEKTFGDICQRVARAVADDEEEAARFYECMVSLRFLPNSPTLMNAGTDIGQLSACFVLPVPDSITGIFDAMKNGAVIHKTGGGTGYNFSHIRPKGSRVQSYRWCCFRSCFIYGNFQCSH